MKALNKKQILRKLIQQNIEGIVLHKDKSTVGKSWMQRINAGLGWKEENVLPDYRNKK